MTSKSYGCHKRGPSRVLLWVILAQIHIQPLNSIKSRKTVSILLFKMYNRMILSYKNKHNLSLQRQIYSIQQMEGDISMTALDSWLQDQPAKSKWGPWIVIAQSSMVIGQQDCCPRCHGQNPLYIPHISMSYFHIFPYLTPAPPLFAHIIPCDSCFTWT